MLSVDHDELMPDSRARLLPRNRRVRHLKRFYFRNLVFTAPVRSQDDSDLLKLKGSLSLPDTGLFPSRSVTNLTESQTERLPLSSVHQNSSRSPKDEDPMEIPSIPSKSRIRRRSTLDWSFAGTNTRQRRFDTVADRRLLDSFFSLHIDGHDNPVYVSEVVKKTTTPNFTAFDLNSLGPGISRADWITLRVWVRRQFSEKFHFLIQMRLHLPELQYVGEAESLGLISLRGGTPPNTVLVELTDGIYTTNNVPTNKKSQLGESSTSINSTRTCTYDHLFKLQVLDQAICDTAQTRQDLVCQISQSIPAVTYSTVDEVKYHLEEIGKNLDSQKLTIDALKKKKANLEALISQRQQTLTRARDDIEMGRKNLESDESREEITALRDLMESTALEVRQHRRRIVLDLLRIFPIESLPDDSFSFTIRGIHLPDSTELFDPSMQNMRKSDNQKADSYAAALGYVAQVVAALESYFDIALPYPLIVRGSASLMEDRISLLPSEQSTFRLANSARITAPFRSSLDSAPPTLTHALGPNSRGGFSSSSSSSNPLLLSFSPSQPLMHPLNPASTPRFRAEYALFLLNKDIQVLANILGLKLVDITQTLPNLKYVLYVASAGEGEIPDRVRGSIKALGLVGSS